MNISLIPSVNFVEEEDISGKVVVIIDVLRATSVITTALNNGAREIIPFIEIEETLKLKSGGALLGGERRGLKIENFDFGNSPLEYVREKVENKTIAMTTTNGTVAINKSLSAREIYIGSMLNGRKVAEKILQNDRDAVIICAGTAGRFSLDDFICAGKIIYEIKTAREINMDDFAATSYMAYRDNRGRINEYIKMASHYKYLVSIGLKEDIDYCIKEDIIDKVPEYRNGKIIME